MLSRAKLIKRFEGRVFNPKAVCPICGGDLYRNIFPSSGMIHSTCLTCHIIFKQFKSRAVMVEAKHRKGR